MARNDVETANLKKKLKGRIIFGTVTVLALAFVTVMASFSWFYTAKEAKVSNISIETVQADNLLIKTPDGEWSKTLKMPFPEDLRMQSVSGNGLNFFQPNLDHEEGKNDLTAVSYKQVAADKYKESGIYEFDFALAVESSMSIYLGTGSALTPAEDSPQSAYGDFSAGYICAAMRAAFLQKVGDSYELKCIWIPNAIVELTTVGGTTLNKSGSVENGYKFITNETGEALTISTDGSVKGKFVADGVTYVWGDLTENLKIGDIVGGEPCELKLLVWIDGNDRECHNALLDGLVSVKLEFSVGD